MALENIRHRPRRHRGVIYARGKNKIHLFGIIIRVSRCLVFKSRIAYERDKTYEENKKKFEKIRIEGVGR